MVRNICPVCGYKMEDVAADYNICPSCGTEFGVSDINFSISELRDAWLKTGPVWWSSVDQVPSAWDPILQLASLLAEQSTATVEIFHPDFAVELGAIEVITATTAGAAAPMAL
jgi:hypothetical protein